MVSQHYQFYFKLLCYSHSQKQEGNLSHRHILSNFDAQLEKSEN